MICVEGDGDGLSQEQELHSFGIRRLDMEHLGQGFLSSIPVEAAAHTMEESIEVGGPLVLPEESVKEALSEVEELEMLYVDESDADWNQQTANKVAVVNGEDAAGEVHEEVAEGVQTEMLQLSEEKSFGQQLESVEEGSTGEVHEEIAEGVQTKIFELGEENSIEKQLESMGEGSQPSPTLEEKSSVESTLDVNINRWYLLSL